MSEATLIPDYAQKNNDLYTLGLYKIFAPGVRQIILYKGSFDRVYPQAGPEEAREQHCMEQMEKMIMETAKKD